MVHAILEEKGGVLKGFVTMMTMDKVKSRNPKIAKVITFKVNAYTTHTTIRRMRKTASKILQSRVPGSVPSL